MNNKHYTIYSFFDKLGKTSTTAALPVFLKNVINISRSFSRLLGFIFVSIILVFNQLSFIFQIFFFPSVVKFILSHFQDQSPSTFLQMNLFALRSLLFLQRQHAVLLLQMGCIILEYLFNPETIIQLIQQAPTPPLPPPSKYSSKQHLSHMLCSTIVTMLWKEMKMLFVWSLGVTIFSHNCALHS